MSKLNLGLVVLYALVVALTLVRLVLPYGISDAKNPLPEIYTPEDREEGQQYLVDILMNNLWDENRQSLNENNEAGGSIQANGEGASNEDPGVETTVLLKLIGVSRSEGEVFAVIEFEDRTERFAPGATLPDGSQLDEILAYGIRVSRSGEHEQLFLFGKN